MKILKSIKGKCLAQFHLFSETESGFIPESVAHFCDSVCKPCITGKEKTERVTELAPTDFFFGLLKWVTMR